MPLKTDNRKRKTISNEEFELLKNIETTMQSKLQELQTKLESSCLFTQTLLTEQTQLTNELRKEKQTSTLLSDQVSILRDQLEKQLRCAHELKLSHQEQMQQAELTSHGQLCQGLQHQQQTFQEKLEQQQQTFQEKLQQ